jgi:aminopeptidase-like protein
MEVKELITKFKIIKQMINKQHDEWVELNKDIKCFNPFGNYEDEEADKDVIKMDAAINYLISSIKE